MYAIKKMIAKAPNQETKDLLQRIDAGFKAAFCLLYRDGNYVGAVKSCMNTLRLLHTLRSLEKGKVA